MLQIRIKSTNFNGLVQVLKLDSIMSDIIELAKNCLKICYFKIYFHQTDTKILGHHIFWFGASKSYTFRLLQVSKKDYTFGIVLRFSNLELNLYLSFPD